MVYLKDLAESLFQFLIIYNRNKKNIETITFSTNQRAQDKSHIRTWFFISDL